MFFLSHFKGIMLTKQTNMYLLCMMGVGIFMLFFDLTELEGTIGQCFLKL